MPDPTHHNAPLQFDEPDGVERLRELLDRVEFNDTRIAELLGIEGARSVSELDLPTLLRRTDDDTPLCTLIRLFLIGAEIDLETFERAIAPMQPRQWVKAELVEICDDSVRATLRLMPFRQYVMAFDLPSRIESDQREDYVMGIGSSSLTLSNLTVRRPCEAALDLGTGCGFQGLLAADHSRRVTAVDTNPRAIHVARFNARLNGLSNVECRQGDLFDPAAGEQFDLVVSNPPFVISPERRYIYRDAGLHGDEITRKIVRQVPDYLCQGGFCQILCNWAHVAGEDWKQRLAGWFDETGCDAWVMRSHEMEAAEYAAKWIQHTEHDDARQYRRRFDQWTAYYRQERIEAMSSGLITMRRRRGDRNWFRTDDGPRRVLGPAGGSVVRGFELRDFLETVSDDRRLMQQRLRISPEVRLQQSLQPCAKGWSVAESELQLSRGLAYSGKVDPYLVGLLARCDGEHRLGELLGELSASLEEDVSEVAGAVCPVVRRLVQRGFLLPEGDAGAEPQ